MYDPEDEELEEQQQPQGSGLGDAAKDYATDKLKDSVMKKMAGQGAKGAAGKAAKGAATKAGASAATSAGSSAAAGAGTSAAAGAAGGVAAGAGGGAAAGAAAGTAGGPAAPITVPLAAAAGAALGALASKLKNVPVLKELKEVAQKAFKWVMMVLFGCCVCSILLSIFLTLLPVLMFLIMLIPVNTQKAEAADEIDSGTNNQFASLEKLASVPALSLGPAGSVNFKNEQLPQKLHFDVIITAKSALTGITCSDTLNLIKKDGSVETLATPTLNCPTSLNAGETRTVSFEYDAPNQDKFKDATVRNNVSLSGKTPDTAGEGASYWIPIRNNVLDTAKSDSVKARALGDYPNNLINATCPGGLTCWDYVIKTARDNTINPTLFLAIWYEESHFSDVGNHFSCPVSVPRTHDGTGLSQSLQCFIGMFNGTVYEPNTEAGFIDAMHHYCGTGPYGSGSLCSNNPNFLPQLRSAYQELGGTVLPLAGGGGTGGTTVSLEATASVIIGEVESCYQFDSSWSESEKAAEEQAIAFLARSPNFMKMVCAAGSVVLTRGSDDTYYGVTNGAHGITIHGRDLGSFSLRLYILAHESGHVIGNENPDDFAKYRASGIFQAEGLMPTYAKDIGLPGVNCSPGQVNPPYACYDESYAEMIGAYVVYAFHSFPARSWSGYPGGVWFNNPAAAWDSFPNDRPQHFNYASDNIFGGFRY